MAVEAAFVEATKLVWAQFGKKIVTASSGTLKEAWKRFNWSSAEEKYRARVFELLSTVRLLGYPDPIDIESIYTDVQVLNKLTAKKRYNFDDIKGKPFEYDIFNSDSQRMSALDIVSGQKRIYILGKPGAGKTTFMKHLAILACMGKIEATPIYIPLKEWSDSQKELIDFIAEKFDICGFPDAHKAIESILTSGKALVLLDGLDEVNHDESQQTKLLQSITNFTNKYQNSRFCITCRIAANDYSFDRFTYVEIADFNEEQQIKFINKWFSLEPEKLYAFMEKWKKTESKSIHDLGRTPLLLTLICLAFGETLQFSKRRVDLYSEAVEALLKKWDSSRKIIRGDIYKQLEVSRKKQLLSYIAFNTFEREEYLIRHEVISDEIKEFILRLPSMDKQIEVDPEVVLNAIESHHGLIVERARNIYSFSHLTVHEYFTALYILDNAANQSLDILVQRMIASSRWREVMLMCSSSLSNATQLLNKFAYKIWETVSKDKEIVALLKANQAKERISSFEDSRNIHPTLDDSCNSNAYEHALDVAANLAILHDQNKTKALNRARHLIRELGFVSKLTLSPSKERKLSHYLSLTSLFIECLHISSVDNRDEMIDMTLKVIPCNEQIKSKGSAPQ